MTTRSFFARMVATAVAVVFIMALAVNPTQVLSQERSEPIVTDNFGGTWAELVLYGDTNEVTIMLGGIDETVFKRIEVTYVRLSPEVDPSLQVQPLEFEFRVDNEIGFLRLDFTPSIYEKVFSSWRRSGQVEVVINTAHVLSIPETVN